MTTFLQDEIERAERAVIRRVTDLLNPGGVFIVSHSESLFGLAPHLSQLRPSIYRVA